MCQFGCGGAGVDGAVGKYQQPVFAELCGGGNHQKSAGHDTDARLCFDDLECRTNGVGRGAARAGYFAVGVAVFYHQTAQIERVFGFLLGFFVGHAFVFAQFVQQIGVNRHFRVSFGIDDGGFANVFQSFVGSHGVNFVGIANEDEFGRLVGQQAVGRFEGTRFVAFGQNDAAQVVVRALFQLF